MNPARENRDNAKPSSTPGTPSADEVFRSREDDRSPSSDADGAFVSRDSIDGAFQTNDSNAFLASSITGARSIQAKLEVSSPEDPLEREADQVADRVMRMPEGGGATDDVGSPTGDDSTDEKIHTKPNGSSSNTAAASSSAIASARGGGDPMPAEARGFFESRMGRDFSDVRIHSGPDAAAAAKSIGAKAYTQGTDVVFGAGHYAPDSPTGRTLLAHELAHVAQQGAADQTIRRQTSEQPEEWETALAEETGQSVDPELAEGAVDQGQTTEKKLSPEQQELAKLREEGQSKIAVNEKIAQDIGIGQVEFELNAAVVLSPKLNVQLNKVKLKFIPKSELVSKYLEKAKPGSLGRAVKKGGVKPYFEFEYDVEKKDISLGGGIEFGSGSALGLKYEKGALKATLSIDPINLMFKAALNAVKNWLKITSKFGAVWNLSEGRVEKASMSLGIELMISDVDQLEKKAKDLAREEGEEVEDDEAPEEAESLFEGAVGATLDVETDYASGEDPTKLSRTVTKGKAYLRIKIGGYEQTFEVEGEGEAQGSFSERVLYEEAIRISSMHDALAAVHDLMAADPMQPRDAAWKAEQLFEKKYKAKIASIEKDNKVDVVPTNVFSLYAFSSGVGRVHENVEKWLPKAANLSEKAKMCHENIIFSKPEFADEYSSSWGTFWFEDKTALEYGDREIRGIYSGGRIMNGRRQGPMIVFDWVHDNGERGKGYWQIMERGKILSGEWGRDDNMHGSGTWRLFAR